MRRKIMKRVLGIDLGTNSLGWAIIEDNKIFDCGVLIFDQGIPLVKGIEAANSPAAERTAFRAARRLKYRRRLRKYHTLKILLENGMCPLTISELQNWIRQGKFPISNKDFIDWLKSTKESNPYYFRAKAATAKVTPLELGRAFFHIAIRRGFKSSKKDQNGTNAKETSELKNKIKELDGKLLLTGQTLGQYLYELVKKDFKIRDVIKCGRVEHYIPEFEKICKIQGISDELRKKLYDALFMQRPLRTKSFLIGKCSLEKKYARALKAHPLFEKYRMYCFVNNIKVRIDDAPERFLDFDERQTALSCFMVKSPTLTFEKIKNALNKKFFKGKSTEFNYRDDQSCASSSLIYQLQNILNCENIFTWKRDYLDVKQHEKVMDYQTVFDGLKYFKCDFDGDDSAFKKFATERLGLSDEKADAFMKINISEGYAKYSLYAIRKILPFLESGYIEPHAVFLAKLPDIFGHEKFVSVKDEVLADFEQCLDDYNWEKRNLELHERRHIISLTERFKELLEEKWKCQKSELDKLYEFKEPSNYEVGIDDDYKLPHIDLGMIYNPMVHRSLTVLRRLVNDLRKSGKIDKKTEIHIELARSVNDKATRIAITEMQRTNETQRQEAREKFAEYNIEPTDEQILCYRLWKEQKHYCIYTGRKINANEIFTNDCKSLDREHTIPRSAGGENNLENLTLCDLTYNRSVKVGKLPSECPNFDIPALGFDTIKNNLAKAGFYDKLEEAEKAYAEIAKKLKNVPASSPARQALRKRSIVLYEERKYWREKMLSFKISREELDGDFSRRQLAATGVMTRHALQFLKSKYENVYANSSTATAFARKEWGLQKQSEKKIRTDHTHHIIDALVIAALDRAALNKISYVYHDEKPFCGGKLALELTYPWATFPEDVHNAAEGVLVKHLSKHDETKQAKRKKVYLANPLKDKDGNIVKHVKAAGDTVRGMLHDQTYYGKIMDCKHNIRTVLRTPLDSEHFKTLESLECIVDKGVRDAVLLQVNSRLQAGEEFKNVFSTEFYMKTKSGAFDGPVIKKVRVYRDVNVKKTKDGDLFFQDNKRNLLAIKKQGYTSRKEYKNNYYAETAKGSNFMVALYQDHKTPADKRIYNYELISLWQWAKEHRSADYIPPQKRTDKGEFIGIINPGVAVLFYQNSPDELKTMTKEQLSKRLYIVTEFTKDGRICLRWHREARAKTDAEAAMKNTFGSQTLSRIEWDQGVPLLCISGKTYQNHTLFADIDFEISTDGKITFKE